MSKSKKEPRSNRVGIQGDLFAQLGEASENSKDRIRWSKMRAELLCRLKAQRALTEGIMRRIGEERNLYRAFARVKANNGSAGVDGETIAEYGSGLSRRIKRLSEALSSGRYRPGAVLLVEIPKSQGGTRCLGIPTVEDRIVQQSILNELQGIYEPYFNENSYGFRPGRSAQAAVERASEYVKEGKVWVVDIDLASFFDEICHERLMNRLSKAISDGGLLKLIRGYLKADLMRGGVVSQRVSGTPQGGPLSPLLSNIVLDELDRELKLRGLSFARYADDCNVYVRSRRSAERVMASLIRFIEGELKLRVNLAKSGVRLCNQVKFLGHTLEQDGKIRIADQSLGRFRKRIIEVTKRNRGVSFERVVKEVNEVIQGWGVYYRRCNTWLSDLRDLDSWIRRRLRSYRLKLCQRRYPTYCFLRSVGLGKHQAWNAVMYHSWWSMANYPYVKQGMGIEWFLLLGLKSLQTIQSVYR